MQTMPCQLKNKKIKIFFQTPMEASIPLKYLAKSAFLHKIVVKLLKMVRLNRLVLEGAETVTSGAVAERLKATVLKTVLPKGNGGSNPSCSASFYNIVSRKIQPFLINMLKNRPFLFWIRNKFRQIIAPYLKSANITPAIAR